MMRVTCLLAVILMAGCQPAPAVPTLVVPTQMPEPSATPFALRTVTSIPAPSATPMLVPMARSTSTATPAVRGCLEPPNDYTRVKVNGQVVNRRTSWLLEQAQALYGGPGNILSVIQGSYTPGLKESFGTHDAGGAADISIRNPANSNEVLWNEAPKMVAAMRQVGFAAWYRPAGLLVPGSGAHIHAIAIGDAELSPAARRQIDGPEGYLRGLDGIPPEYGGPHPDPHGGPVLCPWMLKLGLQDLRP